jgi:hypothetical protein
MRKNREGQRNETIKMLRLKDWRLKKEEQQMMLLPLKGGKNWQEREKSEELKELPKLHQGKLSQLLTKG